MKLYILHSNSLAYHHGRPKRKKNATCGNITAQLLTRRKEDHPLRNDHLRRCNVPMIPREHGETRQKHGQRSQMETDVARRAASTGPDNKPSGGGFWRHIQANCNNAVTTYTTSGPPIGGSWQEAPGSSTKSQSQGSYVDPQGNQVNYVKEIYTSSDPGKEYSMLTQEEKKALEEPLQPGVVSRHVTSKYYKKSTYTSQSTTSTNQEPPAMSFSSMQQPSRFIDAPRPVTFGPGNSQF